MEDESHCGGEEGHTMAVAVAAVTVGDKQPSGRASSSWGKGSRRML